MASMVYSSGVDIVHIVLYSHPEVDRISILQYHSHCNEDFVKLS